MNITVKRYWERRKERLLSRGFRMDEEEENNSGNKIGHGNTKLPYGLAKGEGIKTNGMQPKDVWDALKEKGYDPKQAYNGLKSGKHGKDLKIGKERRTTDVTITSIPKGLKQSSSDLRLLGEYIGRINQCDDEDAAKFLNIDISDKVRSAIHLIKTSTDDCKMSYYPWGAESLKVPSFNKNDTEETKREKTSAFVHEYTHLLNHTLNHGKEFAHARTEDTKYLRDSIEKESGNFVSKEAMDIFKNFDKEYTNIIYEASDKEKVKDFRLEFAKKQGKGKIPEFIKEDGKIDWNWCVIGEHPDGYKKYDFARIDIVDKYNKKLQKAENDRAKIIKERARACCNGASCLQGLYDSVRRAKKPEGFSGHWFGHEESYLKKDGNDANELLSEYVAAAVAYPDMLKVFEKDYPETSKSLRKLMVEMAGEGK